MHKETRQQGQLKPVRIQKKSPEGFWSQMKRSIDGTYHCVSPKYLQLYVNEFVFRYNQRSLPVFPALIALASQPFAEVGENRV